MRKYNRDNWNLGKKKNVLEREAIEVDAALHNLLHVLNAGSIFNRSVCLLESEELYHTEHLLDALRTFDSSLSGFHCAACLGLLLGISNSEPSWPSCGNLVCHSGH